MASRSLDDLAAPVKRAALEFLGRCAAAGLHVQIYCTLRPRDEQARLFAQGRTAPGPVVTACRPGESLHNPDRDGKSWAFDAVPVVNGIAQWDAAAAIDKMGQCGEAAGLTWAGRWSGPMRERVHFEMKGRKV